MTAAIVSLVILTVVLWPRGLTPHRAGARPAGPGGGRARPQVRPVLAGVRGLLARQVGSRRVRRGWVADFAELAAVGLDAGLPSAESALLACAVGQPTAHAGLRALGDRLVAVEATGGRVGDCLAERALGDPDLTFLAAAWQLTDEFGVAAAPAARVAAEVLRERAAADDRRSVLAAGPRASMWLLTLLPLSGPAVAVLLGLPVDEVYGGYAALVAAAVGLALTCAGWLWARGLLRRALRPAEVG